MPWVLQHGRVLMLNLLQKDQEDRLEPKLLMLFGQEVFQVVNLMVQQNMMEQIGPRVEFMEQVFMEYVVLEFKPLQ